MKKLLTSLFATSLGLVALVSCGNSSSGDTASTPEPTPSSSVLENNAINTKKEQCYLDGLKKSLDLSTLFEFKGSTSIDNLEFTYMGFGESQEIVSVSGHTITSIGYGVTTLQPVLKDNAPVFCSFSSKTIYIRVLNPENIVHSFVSSNTGTSKMTFDIKKDGSFLFTRTAGTIPQGSSEMNVSEANIEGTYKLGEDGMFVFTPKTSDYCEFKATIEYDKTDGSEYHLNVFSPINKDTMDYNGIKFNVAK